MSIKSMKRQLEKMEREIDSAEGCESCLEYDGIPALSDAAEEQAMLNEYAAKAKKPEDVEYSVAVKALCKDCRRAYIQIIHVEVVESRRNESTKQA